MTSTTHIDTPVRGLHASAPRALPFAPDHHVRAFLLERARGNVLIYSVDGLEADAAAFDELGGVARQYLNHRHEAMFASERIAVPLFAHERERHGIETNEVPLRGTFSRRHMLDEDFEVIPTPGHTTGATAYLWESAEHRFLFTGDSVYLRDGEWIAAVLERSDRARYLESLELIRELDFDVLVPWAASAGQPYHAITSRAATRRRIDAIMARVRRGEDH